MRKVLSHILFCFLMLCSANIAAQVLIVDATYFGIDEERSLILIQSAQVDGPVDRLDLNGTVFTFDNVISPDNKTRYQAQSSSKDYTVYFTDLPIIKMEVDDEIVDEPKTLGHFSFADADQSISSFIGVELRGNFALVLSKKTYDLEFYEDELGEKKENYQFGNLRSDDDWVLDALYNEPLRITSYLSHKLWLDLHSPHYLEEEARAKAGADGLFVEVFLNDEYRGLYLLMEQVDRKLLQLDKGVDELSGVLYKGDSFQGTQFKYLLDYEEKVEEWSGYSLSYPELDDVEEPWLPLYELIDFVVNEEDEVFEATIFNRISKENFLDYFLFLNVTRAIDNTGKNIYLGRSKKEGLFFYTPWDLDGTFGFKWDGTRDTETEGLLVNDLFSRIFRTPESKAYLRERYWTLRNSLFSEMALFSKAQVLNKQLDEDLIYEREAVAWPEYIHDPEDLTYMKEWIYERMDFIDRILDFILPVKEEISSPLLIGPNPVHKELFVITNKQFDYVIIDVNGQIVSQGSGFQGPINVEDLESGVYFISVNGKGIMFSKL